VIEAAAASATGRLRLQAGDFFKNPLPAADTYLIMDVILVRAQQSLQHTRCEGGVAPAALTGDHNAPLPLPAITRRRHDQSPRPPSLRLRNHDLSTGSPSLRTHARDHQARNLTQACHAAGLIDHTLAATR
jgi:hypothetical protein